MAKILNYGSLNIDYVYDVPHFVKAGETLSSTSRNIFAGGKGLNQSVALSRAGGDVYHAGAVGKDDSISSAIKTKIPHLPPSFINVVIISCSFSLKRAEILFGINRNLYASLYSAC